MNVLNFLDANVWLALLWNRHVHAEKAREWFERSSDEQFFFCRFTQLTVLRLLTTEGIIGKEVHGMSQAWDLWDKIWADPRISFLPEPENLETEFRALTRSSGRSPKVWADAYLLSFAIVAGVKLVTFDRAIQSRKAEILIL
jgi:toxin-antitoxin system PIN domain toxin